MSSALPIYVQNDGSVAFTMVMAIQLDIRRILDEEINEKYAVGPVNQRCVRAGVCGEYHGRGANAGGDRPRAAI
jgi:hypothetical protein